jgi:hypothetical protein
MSSSVNNDKRNYSLIFNSIFFNETIQKSFLNFLSKELNREPLEFIIEVETLKKNNKLIEKSEYIYLKYIKEYSSHEINMSTEYKNYFKDYFEKNTKNGDLEKYFEQLVFILKKELEYDNFMRFIKSKDCEKLIELNKTDDKIVFSEKIKKFPYSNLDFHTYFITEKDIEFMDHISKDNFDLKLVYKNEKTRTNAFISTEISDFLPNISFGERAVMSKYTMIYPFSIEKTLQIQFHFNPIHVETLKYIKIENMKEEFEKLDENIKNYNGIDNYDEKRIRNISCYQLIFDMIAMIPKQTLNCVTSFVYNPIEEELKYYGKLVVPEKDIEGYVNKVHEKTIKINNKEKKIKYKSAIGFSFGSLKKLGDNKTSCSNFTVLTIAKNKKVTKFLMKMALPKMIKEKIKIINDLNDQNNEIFNQDFILYKQVKDLMEYYENLFKKNEKLEKNEKMEFNENEKMENENKFKESEKILESKENLENQNDNLIEDDKLNENIMDNEINNETLLEDY